MQSTATASGRYDATTILFHWLTVGLVTAQFTGAMTIDLFPSGPLRVDARSMHITLGATLAVTLVARLVWRATRGRRLAPADTGVMHLAAKATHWGLYAGLAAVVSAGLFLTWTRGDSLFNLVTIPAFRPGDKTLAHQVQDIHGLIAWLLLGLAGLHASAALFHRYVWHDRVLARMLPRG